MGLLGDLIAWGLSGAIVNGQNRREEAGEEMRASMRATKLLKRLQVDEASFNKFNLKYKIYDLETNSDDFDFTITLHVYGDTSNEHKQVKVSCLAFDKEDVPVKDDYSYIYIDEEFSEALLSFYDLKNMPGRVRMNIEDI